MYRDYDRTGKGDSVCVKYEIRPFLYENRIIRVSRKAVNLHNHETL